MVAMDFFAALNCYDFLNQYCSNLLKNPTVRGLTIEEEDKEHLHLHLLVSSRCISSEFLTRFCSKALQQ